MADAGTVFSTDATGDSQPPPATDSTAQPSTVDAQPDSPLFALPKGPLQHILLLACNEDDEDSEGGEAAAIRATCHFLRDTFDACNTRLLLGGPEERSKAETCLFVPTGEALWQQAPGQRSQLLNLLRGTPRQPSASSSCQAPPGLREQLVQLLARSACVTQLTLRPHLTWLSLAEVVAAAGPGLCGRLTRLVLRGRDDLVDLTPVGQACTALQELDLTYCRNLQDLAPLHSLKHLRQLDLWNCRKVTDITPLAGCKRLEQLHLYNTAVADLAPLASCTNLEYLNLWGCREVKSLAPLAALTKLKYLDCGACRSVESVGPLSRLTALQHLSLYECLKVRDLSPLSGCVELQRLELNGCEVTDVSPLAALPALEVLDLRESRGVASLAPVDHVPCVYW